MTALAARLPADGGAESALPRLGLAAGAPLRIALVVNADAGSVRRLGRERLDPLIKTALGDTPAEVLWTPREALEEALAEALAGRPDVLAVLGGDGTARSAITAARGLVPVAPLPGGTLNRLARVVFGGRDLQACIAALRDGRACELPAGRIGPRRFFVVCGFGPLMELDRAREDWRGSGRLSAVWPRVTALGRRAFEPDLAWSVGEEEHSAAALVVALGPVDAAFGLGRAGERTELEAAGARLSGWRDLAGLGLGVAVRRWRRRRSLDVARGVAIQVSSRRGPVYALLDGERCLLPPRFTVRFEPRAALVWAPAPQPKAMVEPLFVIP